MIPWENCKLWVGYPLQNGVWPDVSRHDNDGALIGAFWEHDSMFFDGINDGVNCGNHSSTEVTTQVTLEAMVKPNTLTGVCHIIRKGESGGVGVPAYYILRQSNNVYQFYVNLSGWIAYTTGVEVKEEWQYVVATYDGTYLKIYVNGTLIGSLHSPGTITGAGATPVYVGTRATYLQSYSGKIAMVRIYNKAFTAQQVKEGYAHCYRLV